MCIALESLKPKGPKLKSEKLSTTLEVKSPTPSLPPKLTYGGREMLHKKAILVRSKTLAVERVSSCCSFLATTGPPSIGSCDGKEVACGCGSCNVKSTFDIF